MNRGSRYRNNQRNRDDSRQQRGSRNQRNGNVRMKAKNKIDPFSGPKVMKNAAPSKLDGKGASILWFRNDLRVQDNEAFNLANTAEIMMPVFVFDRSHFGVDNASPYGFQRTGPFRAHFMRQAVTDLRDKLISMGSDMLIRTGNPIDVLEEVVGKLIDSKIECIHFVAHKETTYEEIAVEKNIEKKLNEIANARNVRIDVHWVWGLTMHHLDDLPFNPGGTALPRTFTSYRKWIESEEGPEVREELEIPKIILRYPFGLMMKSEIPSLSDDLEVEGAYIGQPNDYPFPDHRAVMCFKGGPTHGEERVKDYIWDKYGLEVYKNTRDSSGTVDYSSKFSPWLALGCLSARSIYWNVRRFEKKEKASESTYWMIFELMVRDYFRWVSASVGKRLFAHNGYKARLQYSDLIWNLKPGTITDVHRERLQKWIDGNTGAPFIDASMRELKLTGFMSNRGRQNVASFLIHDLEFPDWRAGAEYFECMLIDHDVASNWGNWATIAGVGSDSRGSKKFNVVKQSFEYDSDGWFIKGWCPELMWVPPPFVHEPHKMNDEQRVQYRNRNEDYQDYPPPIVRLPTAPKGTKAKVETPFPPVPELDDFDFDDDDDDNEEEDDDDDDDDDEEEVEMFVPEEPVGVQTGEFDK